MIAAILFQAAAIIALCTVSLMQRRRIHSLELIAGYQLTRMSSLVQVLHGKMVILDQTEDGRLRCVRLNLLSDTDTDIPNTETWRVSRN